MPTHQPPLDVPPGQVRFITDGIGSCVAQAKAAAGDRNVLVHGAVTAQECLRAGVLDELQIHLIPFLQGRGRRLFVSRLLMLLLGKVPFLSPIPGASALRCPQNPDVH